MLQCAVQLNLNYVTIDSPDAGPVALGQLHDYMDMRKKIKFNYLIIQIWLKFIHKTLKAAVQAHSHFTYNVLL